VYQKKKRHNFIYFWNLEDKTRFWWNRVVDPTRKPEFIGRQGVIRGNKE